MYFLLHPLPHLSCPSAWSLEVHCHCLLFLCNLHSSRGSFIRRSHLQANYEPWPGSIMSQLNGYTDISTVTDEKGEAAHPHGGRKTKLVGRLRSCRRMNATTWLERSKGISCSAVLALASRTHARGVHGTTPSIFCFSCDLLCTVRLHLYQMRQGGCTTRRADKTVYHSVSKAGPLSRHQLRLCQV